MVDASRNPRGGTDDDTERPAPEVAVGDAPVVVVAEDDSDILDLLTEVFVGEGFRVCPCGDSQTATMALASTPPDLFITDVRLRGDAPLGALRRLVERGGPLPPVIVLTGIPDQVRATHAALLEQASAHVEAKPFDLDNLIDLVHTLTHWPAVR
jgi:DNA-binding response OmpR family regulator